MDAGGALPKGNERRHGCWGALPKENERSSLRRMRGVRTKFTAKLPVTSKLFRLDPLLHKCNVYNVYHPQSCAKPDVIKSK